MKVLNHLYVITSALALTALCGGCSQQKTDSSDVIYASIAPVQYIVEAIVGDSFRVEVLVPAGASPETFEPTPKQYIALNEAQAVMSVGLIDFEANLLSKLSNKSRLINLSQGVELIEGSCSHNHGAGEHHHHHHGVDPHIWTSPIELQRMALNCYTALEKSYPDSLHFRKNYQALQLALEELDVKVSGAIMASGIESFVIHHPAYSYFARDYNLEQISIQNQGKEPSVRRVGEIIEQARKQGIAQILYQKEFPATVVEVIASDAGAEVAEVDPLKQDVIEQVEEFVSIITRKR